MQLILRQGQMIQFQKHFISEKDVLRRIVSSEKPIVRTESATSGIKVDHRGCSTSHCRKRLQHDEAPLLTTPQQCPGLCTGPISSPSPLSISVLPSAATKCHTPFDPFDTPDQFGSPCYEERAEKKRQGESSHAKTTPTIIKSMFWCSLDK